ncbi:MAG: GntR family transcriptional regulator, partial [Acetobacteraceae bacterium]|nr:GntR family transcriptional regulator [Acetobacteraceae bacterium]
ADRRRGARAAAQRGGVGRGRAGRCPLRPPCYDRGPARRSPSLRSFFSPYPKCLQIRRLLLDRIKRGLAPGDRLPTEHALCAEVSVSRETVRAALGALEEDGIIERAGGRGTFVARRRASRPARRSWAWKPAPRSRSACCAASKPGRRSSCAARRGRAPP